ncbi:MAG: transglutaminase domain-containing protein [Chloroflexota bacterium]|nr:transglutaminase domain-containing protein [Chloroflexota bacterium]
MAASQAIKQKAAELCSGRTSLKETYEHIARFVRDSIPYHLDEWDVSAEEVLLKKKGMCAGKALLAVELYRAAGIPARYKVVRIPGEKGLFDFLLQQLEEPSRTTENQKEIAQAIRALPPHRDHIIVQVLLDGIWKELDLARDSHMDRGMHLIGFPKETNVLSEEGPFDCLDEWLEKRMSRRSVTRERDAFFTIVNQQIERIRQIGRTWHQAGFTTWTNAEIWNALRKWELIPGCPIAPGTTDISQLAAMSRTSLGKYRVEDIITWLYALVRTNVKRGRFWYLPEALTHHRADCLAYAQIMTFLATGFGMDARIIEVIQDNRGNYVPHYVCMVHLKSGRKRLVDPWYGSADVRHRIVAADVQQEDRTVTRQLTMKELESFPRAYGLEPAHLAGISFYIKGNSYLEQGLVPEAIECYNASLWLYPANPRTLFNRALAFERLHQSEKSQADYQYAFDIDPSCSRILATIAGMKSLMELDERGIEESEQERYLIRNGFLTG